MQRSRRLLLIATAIVLTACTGGTAPLQAIDRPIDLPRFMGDWYVIASIPIFLEKGAHNAVESYRLGPDGVIETTYSFHQDAFDGPVKTFHPRGFVTNTATNAEWGMQFVWPFKAPYLVIYLDDAYQRTVIGVPGRQWVWLMARTPSVGDAAYAEMLEAVRAAGYDASLVERVPQRWPDQPGR